MNERVGKLTAQPRFNASLLSLFAAVSVLLAAIGLYGVVSFLVSQRTQEFGVRIALGATPANIMRLVLVRSARWTAAGLALGVVASIAARAAMRGLLFGVSGNAASTLAIPVLLLIAIALARRLDPLSSRRPDRSRRGAAPRLTSALQPSPATTKRRSILPRCRLRHPATGAGVPTTISLPHSSADMYKSGTFSSLIFNCAANRDTSSHIPAS